MGRSKAEQIREMYEEGYTVSEIAKSLGIRYQHAYNVVSAHLKKRQTAVREVRAAAEQNVAATKTTEEVSAHDGFRALIRRILGV